MQSGTTNPSQNLNPSASTPAADPVTLGTRPSADGIQRQFEHGASPLDFVKRNLERLASQGLDPARAVSQPGSPQPSQGQPPSAPAPQSPSSPAPSPVQSVDVKPADGSVSASGHAQDEGTVGEGEPASSLPENIKNIRKSLNEAKTKLQEKESELKKITEERDKYQKGEVLPDVVKELEARVQELSKYEALVNLESSPEFQETYVKPLETLQTKLNEIAKDYEIPEDVISQLLTIPNQRELNRFLSDHFDSVGALEVKNILTQVRTLHSDAEAAKTRPKEALAKLVAEGAQVRESRMKTARAGIAVKAKDAWAKSLTKIRSDGKIPELIITGNDNEHDEKVAKPIITAAATEYGKMVSKLVDAGLSDLTDELSDAIANMVLLAHASAVSIEQRNEAVRMYNDIEANSRRENPYVRPPVGGTLGTGSIGTPPKPVPTTEQGARSIMETVLANRQNKVLAQGQK